jgi:hypothetical protein
VIVQCFGENGKNRQVKDRTHPSDAGIFEDVDVYVLLPGFEGHNRHATEIILSNSSVVNLVQICPATPRRAL